VPSYGDILIIADLPDSNGVNPKSRLCVVVKGRRGHSGGRADLRRGDLDHAPGVHPARRGRQAVPHPRGHPKIGLKTRCAAFARWMVEVAPGQIGRKIGHVPPRDLLALIEILDRLYPSADADDEIDPVTPDPGT
jgi:hypothetical protein